MPASEALQRCLDRRRDRVHLLHPSLPDVLIHIVQLYLGCTPSIAVDAVAPGLHVRAAAGGQWWRQGRQLRSDQLSTVFFPVPYYLPVHSQTDAGWCVLSVLRFDGRLCHVYDVKANRWHEHLSPSLQKWSAPAWFPLFAAEDWIYTVSISCLGNRSTLARVRLWQHRPAQALSINSTPWMPGFPKAVLLDQHHFMTSVFINGRVSEMALAQYDMQHDTWQIHPPRDKANCLHPLTVIENEVWCVETPTSVLCAYDWLTRTWRTVGSVPRAISIGDRTVALLHEDSHLLITNRDESHHYLYDLAIDEWSRLSPDTMAMFAPGGLLC